MFVKTNLSWVFFTLSEQVFWGGGYGFDSPVLVNWPVKYSFCYAAHYPNLELIEGKSDYLYTVAKDSHLEGKKNPKSKSRDYKILIFDPHGTWPLSEIKSMQVSPTEIR